MQTRSQTKRSLIISIPKTKLVKKQKIVKPMKNMQESQYNMFGGQQICTFRDMDMKQDYRDTVVNTEYLQVLFDCGSAVVDMGIVKKDENGQYQLNSDFGDYQDWIFAEKRISDNCQFLNEMGHPLFV